LDLADLDFVANVMPAFPEDGVSAFLRFLVADSPRHAREFVSAGGIPRLCEFLETSSDEDVVHALELAGAILGWDELFSRELVDHLLAMAQVPEVAFWSIHALQRAATSGRVRACVREQLPRLLEVVGSATADLQRAVIELIGGIWAEPLPKVERVLAAFELAMESKCWTVVEAVAEALAAGCGSQVEPAAFLASGAGVALLEAAESEAFQTLSTVVQALSLAFARAPRGAAELAVPLLNAVRSAGTALVTESAIGALRIGGFLHAVAEIAAAEGHVGEVFDEPVVEVVEALEASPDFEVRNLGRLLSAILANES
jgi:hypothetical protein